MPRAFTAIDIPQNIAEKLAETQQKIGVGKPKSPEKMHITLEFFQDINEKEIETIQKGLERTKLEPFQVKVKGLGVFPSKDHIRVLWAGIDSNSIREVYRETSKSTPESDNTHEFMPHVTISRVKNMRRGDKKKIHRGLEKYQDRRFGEFEASNIKLYRSDFTQKGTKYTELYVEDL